MLMEGDMRQLTVEERLLFVKDLCRSLGLNWRTRPFEYIVFTDRDQDEEQQQGENQPAGKMILYAKADCAAQLRKIHKVGIEKNLKRWRDGEFYYAEANLFIHEKAGLRTDSAIGIVWLKKWKREGNTRKLVDVQGRQLANLMMKAETKAKRRGTFSICGLHMLDESELEDLTNITYDVTESGRVVEVLKPGQPAQLEAGAPIGQELYELAVAIAQRDSKSTVPFKQRVNDIEQDLRKKNSAQIDLMRKQFAEPMPAQSSRPSGREQTKSPGAAAASTEAPLSEVPPDNFDGLTLRAIENGNYQITGLKSVLRECWPVIKVWWRQNASPPQFIILNEEEGKGPGHAMRILEEAHIKFRWR